MGLSTQKGKRKPKPKITTGVTGHVDDRVIDIEANTGSADAKVPASGTQSYSSYQFTANNLDQFNGFIIKVVTSSTNESTPVELRDFRVIALA